MKFFYKDLVLEIPDSVYYPREDSLLLAKILEKEFIKMRYDILDMGCGDHHYVVVLVLAPQVNGVGVVVFHRP